MQFKEELLQVPTIITIKMWVFHTKKNICIKYFLSLEWKLLLIRVYN